MGLPKLDNLYRQVILDYFSHSYHRGGLTDSTSKIELNNPTCGDVTELQVNVKDGVIKSIAFDSSGCSTNTTSVSVVIGAVTGKSIEEAEHLTVDFLQLVQGKKARDPNQLGDAVMFGDVAKPPARIKCAAPAWKALGKAAENDGTTAFHHYRKEEE